MVGAKGLGDEARQAQWAPKGHSRRRAQAGGHSASHVDGPNRVQLVEEGGCGVTSNNETKGFLQYGGEKSARRGGGGGGSARFFLRSQTERVGLPHLFTTAGLAPHTGGRAPPRREQWARQG